MKTYAILLASGTGERVKASLPKQFIKISGKTVLEHSIEVFENNKLVDDVIIVIHKDFFNLCGELCKKNNFRKISKILVGGMTRQESSSIGINSITDYEAKVLIHDAVRPFLNNKIIDKSINLLDKYDAIDVAIPTADTIIKVDENMRISDIPERKWLMRGQTPQSFKLSIIKRAHELAKEHNNTRFTDDCGLVKQFGVAEIHVINGDESNIKITYPIDIFIADKLFQLKNLQPDEQDLTKLKNKVLVIFGSNSGIGKSMFELAQKHEAKVHGFSKSSGVDVRDQKSIESALQKVYAKEGKIDFIVNTAGILKVGTLISKAENDIRDEIETNYLGCINIARAAHEYLKKSNGTLLFFASSSYTRGRETFSIYSSTKAAVVNLAQALSEEWSNDNIRINVINPERTATPMRTSNFGNEPAGTLLSAEFVAKKSLGTLLQNYTGQIVDIRNIKKQQ